MSFSHWSAIRHTVSAGPMWIIYGVVLQPIDAQIGMIAAWETPLDYAPAITQLRTEFTNSYNNL
jgi:hypothetical protein